jgi:hypothetical protein
MNINPMVILSSLPTMLFGGSQAFRVWRVSRRRKNTVRDAAIIKKIMAAEG